MYEILPVLAAFAFGVALWPGARGGTRLLLSCCAVAISGISATLLSGEFTGSWVFLLLDLGEAALGLALGFLLAGRLPRARTARGRRSVTAV